MFFRPRLISNIKSLLILLLILVAELLSAQNTTFRAITMDNGLSNFVVTSLFKDSTGFMWIGTDVSLDRFDGINFKHFEFSSNEINKKRVKCISETFTGEIYVGNEIGLWHLNNEKKELELFKPETIDLFIVTATDISCMQEQPLMLQPEQ